MNFLSTQTRIPRKIPREYLCKRWVRIIIVQRYKRQMLPISRCVISLYYFISLQLRCIAIHAFNCTRREQRTRCLYWKRSYLLVNDAQETVLLISIRSSCDVARTAGRVHICARTPISDLHNVSLHVYKYPRPRRKIWKPACVRGR